MTEILLWAVGAFWLLTTLSSGRDLFALPVLPPADPGRPDPAVTVVVASRDEAASVERTARRFLAQRGVDLELVVVDDRSSDDTSQRLARIAADDPRLRPVRVDALPDGWLGKCHALHVGASDARGDWLLFADADTTPDDDVVRRAIDAARAADADHVTLLPDEEGATLPGRAAVLPFAMLGLGGAARANRDERWGFCGVGAFNLVRRERYERVGGHRALRYEVVDDLKLAVLVARDGGRSRVLRAARWLRVRWAGSASGLVRALTKNAFAMMDYSVPLALLAVCGMLATWLAGLLGWLHGSSAGLFATGAYAASLLPALAVALGMRWGPAVVVLSPLLAWVFPFAILRSTVVTLRDGGVRWRETLYPLDRLRREGVPLFLRRASR